MEKLRQHLGVHGAGASMRAVCCGRGLTPTGYTAEMTGMVLVALTAVFCGLSLLGTCLFGEACPGNARPGVDTLATRMLWPVGLIILLILCPLNAAGIAAQRPAALLTATVLTFVWCVVTLAIAIVGWTTDALDTITTVAAAQWAGLSSVQQAYYGSEAAMQDDIHATANMFAALAFAAFVLLFISTCIQTYVLAVWREGYIVAGHTRKATCWAGCARYGRWLASPLRASPEMLLPPPELRRYALYAEPASRPEATPAPAPAPATPPRTAGVEESKQPAPEEQAAPALDTAAPAPGSSAMLSPERESKAAEEHSPLLARPPRQQAQPRAEADGAPRSRAQMLAEHRRSRRRMIDAEEGE